MILYHGTNTDFQQIRLDDVVIGPIANDTVGFQIRRYTEGIITKAQFLEEIKYHQVTMQYFFGTEQALSILIRK